MSIVLPIYNVEKYLNRCIKSILNQTYSDLEVILVDDGSPDGCPRLCDEWSKKDKRIKVVHKKCWSWNGKKYWNRHGHGRFYLLL